MPIQTDIADEGACNENTFQITRQLQKYIRPFSLDMLDSLVEEVELPSGEEASPSHPISIEEDQRVLDSSSSSPSVVADEQILNEEIEVQIEDQSDNVGLRAGESSSGVNVENALRMRQIELRDANRTLRALSTNIVADVVHESPEIIMIDLKATASTLSLGGPCKSASAVGVRYIVEACNLHSH